VTTFFALHKKFVFLSNQRLKEVREQATTSEQKDNWPALFKLTISIFSRSIMSNGLTTFIPLYWVAVLMRTQQQGSLMVTLLAMSSAVASFTGGRLADHFGFSRVIRITFTAAVPLIILLPTTGNVWLATALAMSLSAMLNLGFGPSVVLGQQSLPNRLGLASGITLGLSVSVGGIFSPILGSIGDAYGLPTVLYILAGVSIVGSLSTLLLKDPKASQKPAQ